MKHYVCGCVALTAFCCYAYQISVGTYVANAGKTVVVPVSIDNVSGLSYASTTITYDPCVLVLTRVEAGTLNKFMSEDFVSSVSNGVVDVSIYGSSTSNVIAGTGSIAKLTFALRTGTEGRFSDITVSAIELGEKTGVKDVTVGNPISIVNGMVRVMSTQASVERLEECQIVCADTKLESLVLDDGDGIQASDWQTEIIVDKYVACNRRIPVFAPNNGWANGRYALLTTPTPGLTFSLQGVSDAIFSEETSDGVTTYYATLSIADKIPVMYDGEYLSAAAKNQIRTLLADRLEGITQITVTGPDGLVGVIADMGIAPKCTIIGTTLKAEYSRPSLSITQFDPMTGRVCIRVTPGKGNSIVSEMVAGYLRVYGTDNLDKPMCSIPEVVCDLTPYLKEATKGEAVLMVTMGTHTFLRVKIEPSSK